MQYVSRFQQVFLGLLLGFLSVLSTSGTIGLRNVLHVAMLGMLLWCLVMARERLVLKPLVVARAVPVSIFAWCTFLVLFPFWAEEPAVAWANLRGQWGVMSLTWLLAWASVVVVGRERVSLWVLTITGAVPVFLHLLLVLLAWVGMLRPVFYGDPTLGTLWLSAKEIVTTPSLWKIDIQPFPLGFRGVEPLHFNIGHAANQSMCLAVVCMLQAKTEGRWREMCNAGLVLMACFLSVLIAGSRGSVLAGLLLMPVAAVLYVLSVRWRGGGRTISLQWRHGVYGGVAAIAALILLTGLFFNTVRADERWHSMWDKMALGWMMDNPSQILCEGLSESDEALLQQRYGERGQTYVQVLKEGLVGQDGGRVLLMRAGFELALQHPMGLDGSRQAYQKRIEQTCGHPPRLAFAHAHQGWINLALALGWLGVGLFAWILLSFTRKGWGMLGAEDTWPHGLALLLLSIFWLVRGMTDAIFQDHYMQMLAFTLLFIHLTGKKEGECL